MAGTTSWDKLSDELSKADDNKFRNKVISLLRILDASFEKCLDIPGADFVVKSSKERFIWVVQCQTFDTEFELVEEHAHQIASVAQSFINEGFICDKYWVLHNHQHGNNRCGKFTKFLSKIEEYKKELETSGKINSFLVLQRQELLKQAEKDFRGILTRLLKEYSNSYRLDIEDKLEFGRYYLSGVPAEEFEISFREYDPLPSIKQIDISSYEKVTDIVVSERKDVRWTLIHGEAGSGKTTTALHATITKSKIVFFVNCDLLDFYSLRSGTNFLFEDILRSLNILKEFESERDRELLYSLSGSTVSKTIEHSENHILVFDGLDENRFYSDMSNQGLKRLSDRLSDIHCPIVLVTRTSHFEESLFSELVTLNGKRGGSKARRKARALKLSNWTKDHVLQLIDRILVQHKKEESMDKVSHQRIHKFRNLFIGDDYKDFYGDLPLNPLFLQFILSDVVDRDIQKVNRPTLIYHWVRSKIYRDLEKEKRTFPINKNLPKIQLLEIIDKLLYVMELTAKKMISQSFELEEFISSDIVKEIAQSIFHLESFEIIDLLLNSVLTTHATLSRESYRSTRNKITFTFKILQEYFLACSLVRRSEDHSKYPKSVQQFCEEIMETENEEEMQLYIKVSFNGLSKDLFSMVDESWYGLNPVFGCQNPNRQGDIIFIHGLMGHAISTWHPEEKCDQESCWLGWIAEDLPDLGIWTFGYEAEISAWRGGGMPLYDQASPLLDELRSRELGDKPIIFITHSLGGLLVKTMLERADKYPKEQKFIQQTKGIVFLATPHSGANLASLIDNFGNIFTRLQPIVKDLKEHTDTLRRINETYRQKCFDWDIATKVYFETEAVHGIKVVNETSADPGILNVIATAVRGANHISIAKPTSKNELYRGVTTFLKDCLPQSIEAPVNLPDKVSETVKVVREDLR